MCVYISFHAENIKYAYLSNKPFISPRTLDFRWTVWIKIRTGLVKMVKPFSNLAGILLWRQHFVKTGPRL